MKHCQINKKLNARNYVMLWGIPEIGKLPKTELGQSTATGYNIPVGMWIVPDMPSEIVAEMINGFSEGYKKHLSNHRLRLSGEVC